MSTEAQDKFVTDVLGVDLSRYAARDDEPDPAPPVDPTAQPLPPPPASGDARLQIAQIEKQIKALDVLGDSAMVKEFRTHLAALQTATEDKAQGVSVMTPAIATELAKLADDVKAEFDQQRAPPQPSPEQLKLRREAATKATDTAGSGTADDSALVVDQLAKMPKALLDAINTSGTKVKVCRGSVTDYLTDLKGVKPRGWPPGSTWDSVPGLQQQNGKTHEVVIATIGHDKGNAHVPVTGEGHGSANLVIHETAHGVDYASDPHVSAGAPFNGARDPDKPALSAYESQPGNAGQEETFAESCARFYSNDPSSASNTPHLHKYWRDNPLGPPDPPDTPASGPAPAVPA